MIYKGDDVKRLIPQRNPFIMVDTLEADGGNTAVTTLAVRHGNYFLLPDGTLAETGLIEHIAQSCSALAGCQALAREVSDPPVGIIGEVKHFTCHRRPLSGECLKTTVTFDMNFGNVTIATGQCRLGDELIAEANLKIFIQ
ncbi:MAG: beta-hydroxyacyl-ACP dehydratase [Prevotella sp.]|jgi:predicted hotdog family 3-hydroxylacyl-ACP dehydratase|nr:beta-hydroxyacyl-ACP dehydratase [Prevotella sp.]